jgi:adenylyltransferase/sulfurtransferase
VHTQDDISVTKVESAATSLRAINPEVTLNLIDKRLDETALTTIIEQVDVVVDCSDNFATRFLLNEVTQRCKKPLVSGAAIRMEGQVTVYDARQHGSACYRCLYTADEGELQQTCSESGVLSPLLGVIGSMQAVETVKLLAGVGESLAGRLLVFDAMTANWRELRIKQDPDCPVCTKL